MGYEGEMKKAIRILEDRRELIGHLDKYRKDVAKKAEQFKGEEGYERIANFLEEDLGKKPSKELDTYARMVMLIDCELEKAAEEKQEGD